MDSEKIYKISDMSNKDCSIFELAKRMAVQSNYDKIKHGAVLVCGGKIVSASFNRYGYSSFAKRFRIGEEIKEKPVNTIHAEWGCILGQSNKVISGGTMYVVRINSFNSFRISRPCPICEQMMRFVGIKKVVYSIDDETYGIWKMR